MTRELTKEEKVAWMKKIREETIEPLKNLSPSHLTTN